MRIFLIGYMGSGKTTVGKLLAERLNLLFIDLDHSIEASTGLPVSDIFQKRGEDFFRQAETAELQHVIAQNEAAVIATGGGTPCFSDNLTRMQATGKTVYLACKLEVLLQRLVHESEQRPLIQREHFSLDEHFKSREGFYRQAQLTVEADASPSDVVDAIIRLPGIASTNA